MANRNVLSYCHYIQGTKVSWKAVKGPVIVPDKLAVTPNKVESITPIKLSVAVALFPWVICQQVGMFRVAVLAPKKPRQEKALQACCYDVPFCPCK